LIPLKNHNITVAKISPCGLTGPNLFLTAFLGRSWGLGTAWELSVASFFSRLVSLAWIPSTSGGSGRTWDARPRKGPGMLERGGQVGVVVRSGVIGEQMDFGAMCVQLGNYGTFLASDSIEEMYLEDSLSLSRCSGRFLTTTSSKSTI
jgi:hypothetical protein